jgi:hypothetical protein
MNISLRKQVEKMLDAYVDWHDACLRVGDAYRNWSCATRPDVTATFAGYMRALDREERAAEVYARLVRRIGDLATGARDPVARLRERAPTRDLRRQAARAGSAVGQLLSKPLTQPRVARSRLGVRSCAGSATRTAG